MPTSAACPPEVLRFEDGRLIEGTPFYYDTAAIAAALA